VRGVEMAGMHLFHVGEEEIEAGQALRQYALPDDLVDAAGLVGRMLAGDGQARAALMTDEGCLRQLFASDPRMQLVLIEAVFERVRAGVALSMLSRFETVFVWPTVELAQAFRARYRPRGVIHRCSLVDGDVLMRDASLVAVPVDLSAVLDNEIRAIEARATATPRYWSGGRRLWSRRWRRAPDGSC
jgi:hypothetical protein